MLDTPIETKPLIDINDDLNEIELEHDSFIEEIAKIDYQLDQLYSIENHEKFTKILLHFQQLKLIYFRINSRINALLSSNNNQPNVNSYIEKVTRSVKTAYTDLNKKFTNSMDKTRRRLDIEIGINKKLYSTNKEKGKGDIGGTDVGSDKEKTDSGNAVIEIDTTKRRLSDGGTPSNGNGLNSKSSPILNKLEMIMEKNKELESLENISKSITNITNELKLSMQLESERNIKIENHDINKDTFIGNLNCRSEDLENQANCGALCKWLLVLVFIAVVLGFVLYYFTVINANEDNSTEEDVFGKVSKPLAK